MPSSRKGSAPNRKGRLKSLQTVPTLHYSSTKTTSSPLGKGQNINTPSRMTKSPPEPLIASFISPSSRSPSSAAPSNNSDTEPWILPILVGINNTNVVGSTILGNPSLKAMYGLLDMCNHNLTLRKLSIFMVDLLSVGDGSIELILFELSFLFSFGDLLSSSTCFSFVRNYLWSFSR